MLVRVVPAACCNAVLLLLTCAGAADARAQSVERPGALALEHVHVVDVRAGRVLEDHTIVVRDRHITTVAPAAIASIPGDARRVDGRGRYVIPGLWDMHVHTFYPPGMEERFGLFVANGVTGIRDMGGGSEPLAVIRQYADAVASGARVGPRVVASGVHVDGRDSRWSHFGDPIADSPARAALLVDSLADAGADFIKVYSYLLPDVYDAIVARAAQRRLPVAGHVPYLVSAAHAARAGQRSFEHQIGIEDGCSGEEAELIDTSRRILEAVSRKDSATANALERDWRSRVVATLDAERCEALLQSLAERGTWQVPTLVQQRLPPCGTGTTAAADPNLAYVPAGVRVEWPQMLESKLGEDHESERALCAQRVQRVGMMHRLGVPILAGTDAGWPYVLWGFAIHDELALLVDAGLSPLDALRSATLEPARYLQATDSLGAVEPGRLADLVLLDGNPLDDIGNTRRITGVVLNGRYLDRAALDALLAAARRME